MREWREEPGDGGRRSQSSQWKLPGGLLERGESFEEAVTREVFVRKINSNCKIGSQSPNSWEI